MLFCATKAITLDLQLFLKIVGLSKNYFYNSTPFGWKCKSLKLLLPFSIAYKMVQIGPYLVYLLTFASL